MFGRHHPPRRSQIALSSSWEYVGGTGVVRQPASTPAITKTTHSLAENLRIP
jgi:hypothetical protein